MGTKRNRFLIRQQRIKRDSDTGTSHHSPDMEIDCPTPLTTSQMLPTNLSGNISLHAIPSFSSNYLTVPTPKIERHSSEPAPNVPPSPPLQVSSTSAHLLNVPSQGMSHHHHTPFLVKQHSHPLLPSQQAHLSSPSSAPITTGNQSSFELQRQYSQPVETTTPPSISISTTSSGVGNSSNFTQFSGGLPGLIKSEHGSSSVILLPESTGPLMTGSFEHTQSLRVKTEELQRSISTPNTVSI